MVTGKGASFLHEIIEVKKIDIIARVYKYFINVTRSARA